MSKLLCRPYQPSKIEKYRHFEQIQIKYGLIFEEQSKFGPLLKIQTKMCSADIDKARYPSTTDMNTALAQVEIEVKLEWQDGARLTN